MRCEAVDLLGQCPEPASTLVQGICRHEHSAIRRFCTWHASDAVSFDSRAYCGECIGIDADADEEHRHRCPVTARVVAGEVDIPEPPNPGEPGYPQPTTPSPFGTAL
jgi:hypothetical protein